LLLAARYLRDTEEGNTRAKSGLRRACLVEEQRVLQ